VIRDATFSACRTWRYRLSREWGDGPRLNIIGLNPSTADETQDDPTIRRCIRFARDWGYSGLVMTNIFAFRSTDPKGLTTARDPIGPDNDVALVAEALAAGEVVAAWGVWGRWFRRGERVEQLLASADVTLKVFGLTKGGYPKHPLYLPADSQLVPLAAAA
jgi:hypothetical protein